MTRRLEYRPAAARALERLDRETQRRVLFALERYAATGHGDIKPLKGEFAGTFRLRVGKWRVFFRPAAPGLIVVIDLDNRGEAY